MQIHRTAKKTDETDGNTALPHLCMTFCIRPAGEPQSPHSIPESAATHGGLPLAGSHPPIPLDQRVPGAGAPPGRPCKESGCPPCRTGGQEVHRSSGSPCWYVYLFLSVTVCHPVSLLEHINSLDAMCRSKFHANTVFLVIMVTFST